MKHGILLLNFGGPWTLSDVKPFLYRLFSNPRVLVGVPTPLRQTLAFLISRLKGPSSVRSYRAIGGGSPQLKWTAIQADRLVQVMPGNEVRVEIGMRSSEPSIEKALNQLKFWGAEELTLLPLFPQFSTTTTATCFDVVDETLARLEWQPVIHKVTSWPDHPAYISLLRSTVDQAVNEAQSSRNGSKGPLHVLFSAHSLPLKIVERGDYYPDEIARTVRAVTEDFSHPWSLAFQSRNGKLPWLGPYLEDEIRRLAGEGVEALVVVPISFVSDHIETLFELDQLYAGLARKHGIRQYHRARCFNGDAEFPRVLKSIVMEAGAC
ncbi:MAG TPA: ferrochelatase [Pyrinomonadaceae bacterium]|jgi:ferrochelatase|nr:ferrochelatase [Pyrinomonadaceae bacterium]